MMNSFINYWDHGVPDFIPKETLIQDEYDVIIVGSGFTGLSAALILAKNGKRVLVLESKSIGYGASSRNGGMVGPSFHKLGITGLTKKYGEESAYQVMKAGVDAVKFFKELIAEEKLNCDFEMSGRFRGIRNEKDYFKTKLECERLNKHVGLEFKMIPKESVREYVGSDAYYGGVFYYLDGGVHPKKLVNELARTSEKYGASLIPNSKVIDIVNESGFIKVKDSNGNLYLSKEVVVATNGYTETNLKDFYKRVVPIDVSVCVTKELGEEKVKELSPKLSMHGETGRVFIWSRPTPDKKRFIFGGRLCSESDSYLEKKSKVIDKISRIYSSISENDIDSIWHGKIAYSSDHSPHINKIDGVWYVGAYCGSGVTRSVYFAKKLSDKILSKGREEFIFDKLVFPKVPFRPIAPLGASLLTKYYAFLDGLDYRDKVK